MNGRGNVLGFVERYSRLEFRGLDFNVIVVRDFGLEGRNAL